MYSFCIHNYIILLHYIITLNYSICCIISSYITLWYVIINIYITYTLRIYQSSRQALSDTPIQTKQWNYSRHIGYHNKAIYKKKTNMPAFSKLCNWYPLILWTKLWGGQKILWEGSFTWQILVRKLTPLWILGSHYFCQGKGCKFSGKSKSHLKLWASWHSLRARWNII